MKKNNGSLSNGSLIFVLENLKFNRYLSVSLSLAN